MSSLPGGRKRAALFTVGRGTRGLHAWWSGEQKAVITGTAIAREENKLNILAHLEAENVIEPRCQITAPAEVWSIDEFAASGPVEKISVAARRGFQSSVEVWRLDGVEDLQAIIAGASDESNLSSGSINITTSASVSLEGQVLRVQKSPDIEEFLSLTQNGAYITDFVGPLRSLSTASLAGEGTFSKLVDATWIDGSTIFIASTTALGIFDIRGGSIEHQTDIQQAVTDSKSASERDFLPPYAARSCSATCDEGQVFYAGGQDGYIRAFDVRTSGMLLKLEHARDHWVSSLVCGTEGRLISGGTDGVVKCWKEDGTPIVTFPQHDDTVTNLSSSESLVASVSYDGRLAINEISMAG